MKNARKDWLCCRPRSDSNIEGGGPAGFGKFIAAANAKRDKVILAVNINAE
jgi:hypothetical protein